MKITDQVDPRQFYTMPGAANLQGGSSFQSALDKAQSGNGAAEQPKTADSKSSGKAGGPTALQELLEYMKKTPEQRMREAILRKMGLTEEDLKNMPPEKRAAVEETIAAKIKELLQEPPKEAVARANEISQATRLGLALR